jgi:ankyrin repeat protein
MKKGFTVLHRAASSNSVDVARLLIEHGANVNVISKRGYTPLHRAALSNSVDVARLLLERGANVHALNFDDDDDDILPRGKSALHFAANKKNV